MKQVLFNLHNKHQVEVVPRSKVHERKLAAKLKSGSPEQLHQEDNAYLPQPTLFVSVSSLCLMLFVVNRKLTFVTGDSFYYSHKIVDCEFSVYLQFYGFI